jgi:hypothetical protein
MPWYTGSEEKFDFLLKIILVKDMPWYAGIKNDFFLEKICYGILAVKKNDFLSKKM